VIRLLGVALVTAVLFILPSVRAVSVCQPGTRVTLRSPAGDARVFVWDTVVRLADWREGRWKSSEDVVDHSLFVLVGMRAITVATNRSTSTACAGDAVAVRLLDQPYRNRYGYVDAANVRIEAP